ncbi:MAG TPA: thiamine-phosphate kinase, partial [Planctomycetes bacterium]|nr:thiamine-phosphate kinase [Planctomycetota bacterium]
PAGRAWRRAGAQAGDRLFVSGPLGLARLGLTYLEQGGDPGDPAWEAPLAALIRPRPRLALARRLQQAAVRPRAALDLSDGLARDLPRLALASGLRAEIRSADLPAPPAMLCAQLGVDPARCALLGGEDYQLLLAGPAELAGDELVDVGALVEGEPGEVLVDSKPLSIKGFDHFA